MQRCLTEDQLARLETLATEAGMTCGGGTCAQLRCGEEARRTHDQGLMVHLCCAEDVHPRGAYQYFTIPIGEDIGA